MKITIMKPVEVSIEYVNIAIPLRYDDEHSMPQDFPLREGKTWAASVELETGRITNWPKDKMGLYSVNEKVCDGGSYQLYGKGQVHASILQNYVPSRLIPGEYGDYVELEILDGVITNWPKKITQETLSEFFPDKDED